MPPLQGDGCVTNSEPGHGTWVNLNCASPGAWTPSDRQIAELEGLLPPPISPLFRPGGLSNPSEAFILQDYARHYAGVTEGDRRIVVGVFVIPWSRDETAGIYIGSERLSCLSSGLPRLIVPDDGVEDGEKLSGDCDKRDHFWFAGCDQAVEEGFQ